MSRLRQQIVSVFKGIEHIEKQNVELKEQLKKAKTMRVVPADKANAGKTQKVSKVEKQLASLTEQLKKLKTAAPKKSHHKTIGIQTAEPKKSHHKKPTGLVDLFAPPKKSHHKHVDVETIPQPLTAAVPAPAPTLAPAVPVTRGGRTRRHVMRW